MRPMSVDSLARLSALGALFALGCASYFPVPVLDFEPKPSPRESLAASRTDASRGPRYVVRPGDTLYSIARSQGTSVEALARANALVDPDRLEVGQQLRVPPGARPVASRPPRRISRTAPSVAAAPAPAARAAEPAMATRASEAHVDAAATAASPASAALTPVDCVILDSDESLRNARFEQALDQASRARAMLRPLESEPGAAQRIARVEVLSGIAEVALGHESAARASFARALAADPLLELESTEVSPKIVRVFEQARAEQPERQARR